MRLVFLPICLLVLISNPVLGEESEISDLVASDEESAFIDEFLQPVGAPAGCNDTPSGIDKTFYRGLSES